MAVRVSAARHDAAVAPQNGPQRAMTEKQLMESIVEAAGYLGYRHMHVFDMRRSDDGTGKNRDSHGFFWYNSRARPALPTSGRAPDRPLR